MARKDPILSTVQQTTMHGSRLEANLQQQGLPCLLSDEII